MAATAARAGWRSPPNSPNVLPDEAARRRRLLDDACAEAGRDEPIAFSTMLGFLIGATNAEADERANRMHQQFGKPPGDPRLMLTGTPDQVIARLNEYAAAGVDRVMLGTLLHRDLEHIELLGRAVAGELVP